MKIIKLQKKNPKLNRRHISKIGESIYHNPDVNSIFIRINFKDGSSISFRRDEEDDDFGLMSEEREDKEE